MHFKTTALFFVTLIVFFSGCGGCYQSTPSNQPQDGSDEQEEWPWPDDDWRRDDIPGEPNFDLDVVPPPPDMDIADDYREDDPTEPDLSPPCPPECLTIPEDGEIGAACVTPADCEYGAMCYSESVEFFQGEMYVSGYGGQCLLIGAESEGCDPMVPATCPSGSLCVFSGSSMGVDYYGCFDACEPMDPFWEPYDYNCGCREGYRCDAGICVDGCSNDRECCEIWRDLNGDYARQVDEVIVKEDCTNVCDNGGLYDEPPEHPGLCAVSFDCINYGDPSTRCGDPCEGDAWCPPGGRCLDEFHYGIPCGYCTIDDCNLVGHGCEECGGLCLNLGYPDDPDYICVPTCHFGKMPGDPDYECRTAPPGCEHACWPIEDSMWHTPPDDGSDGYCWIGNFPGGDSPIGSACEEDEECVSPFGLGTCWNFTAYVPMAPFCSAACHETASEEYAICGHDLYPDDPEDNTATGACWSHYCWEGCDNPDGPLGSNGCTQSEAMACYETFLFGSYITAGDGLDVPPGICVPACMDNAWCADFFGMPMSCNTETGVCG